jgi:glycerophosphoryl diester phosphodiesterase
MDVCETKDKVLVVHHDRRLKRTCGIDEDIGEFRYEELPNLLSEIVLDFGVDHSIRTKHERIPTL